MDSSWQRSLALFRSSSLDSKENQEKKDKKEPLGDRGESVLQERLANLDLKDRKALWDVMEKLARVE